MKSHLVIFALALIVLAVAYLGPSAFIYHQVSAVYPKCQKRGIEATFTPDNFQPSPHPLPKFNTAPYLMPVYETVSFPSRDAGITLSAFYMPAQGVADPATAPAVIIVHGLNDCKQRTFILTAAGMLNKHGFNVLALDLRDHGDSTIEDGRQSAGGREQRDVLGGFDWLMNSRQIPPQHIGLMGFSLGAAAALIAAGQEPRIAAVWEDSGYSNLRRVIRVELARNHIPALFMAGAVFMGRVLTGDNLLAYSPIDGVARLNGRPLYIVHGTGDRRIDVVNAAELAAAANAQGGNVIPWITDSDHVESIFYYPDEYERRLVAFFSQSLAQ